MLIENAFTVGAPADRLWARLLDVERVVPCLPGAELTETVDDHTWKGTFHVRFGPVAMAFAGTVVMEDRDDDAHRIVLRAKGMEERGKGAAQAKVTARLEPGTDAETQVRVESDIILTGAAAQLSRGLLPEISRRLTQEFADRLQASMTGTETPGATSGVTPEDAEGTTGITATPVASEAEQPLRGPIRPVGGIRLALAAAWAAIRRFVRHLLRRGGEEE